MLIAMCTKAAVESVESYLQKKGMKLLIRANNPLAIVDSIAQK